MNSGNCIECQPREAWEFWEDRNKGQRSLALAYPAALLSSCKCQPRPITANGSILRWLFGKSYWFGSSYTFVCHLDDSSPMPCWRPKRPAQASYSGRQDSGFHLPASSRRLLRAISTQLINTDPAKGLARKEMAPAFSACVRMFSSGNAVIKINGAS